VAEKTVALKRVEVALVLVALSAMKVVEAKRPDCAHIGDVVAAERRPKFDEKEKAGAPAEVIQLPLLSLKQPVVSWMPLAKVEVALLLNVLIEPAVMRPETANSEPGVVVPTPTFPPEVTINAVDVPVCVEVEMAKRFRFEKVEVAEMARRAQGEVEEMPREAGVAFQKKFALS